MTQLPSDSITMFLALCDPYDMNIPSDISQQSWDYISYLSKLHGLTPFLFYRTRQLGIQLPEEIKKEWLGIYLYSLAQDQKARRQIKDLKETLDPEGIPFILLKGASAMVRLHPEPGLRTFCDIDILIPPENADRFKKVMKVAGYKPCVVLNSPEEEEVLKFESHLPAIKKGDELPIETHLGILGRPEYKGNGLEEIWEEKQKETFDGTKVYHLGKEHYLIHMLLHFEKHLRTEGNLEIKSLVDALAAIRAWKIDWVKFWAQAERWKIRSAISPVMAGLNQCWGSGIPISEKVEPFNLENLLLNQEELQKTIVRRIPGGFISRVLKARGLPDYPSRVKFLFHIFFPTREHLRYRYNLSSKWSILPYYIFHIIYICKKFFTGLWYQILFHPKPT